MATNEYQAYEGVCPNCGAVLGMDEVDHEYCASCGYNDDTILDGEEEDYGYDEELDEEHYPCGCGFCNCTNDTIAGEVCNQCLSGAHQG